MTQGLYYKDSSLRQVLPEKTASYVSQLPKKAGGVATLLQWLKMVRVCCSLTHSLTH